MGVLLLAFEMVSILAAIPNMPTQTQKFLPPEELKKDSYKSPEAFKMCLKGGIICVPQNYSKFELPDPTNPTKVCFFKEYNPMLILLIIAYLQINHEEKHRIANFLSFTLSPTVSNVSN